MLERSVIIQASGGAMKNFRIIRVLSFSISPAGVQYIQSLVSCGHSDCPEVQMFDLFDPRVHVGAICQFPFAAR